MPRKSSKTKKPVVRHHPFERARSWAEKRLVRAEEELKKYTAKVVALNAEIPKLREVIRVHGGSDIGRHEYPSIGQRINVGDIPRDRELLGDLPVAVGSSDDEFLPDVK